MNNVYIVTSGEYSAYCISAVFSDKELAQKYIDSFEKPKWDSYSIEEYELNPHAKEIKKGKLRGNINDVVVDLTTEFYYYLWSNKNQWQSTLRNKK